jgi:hypothetical protein
MLGKHFIVPHVTSVGQLYFQTFFTIVKIYPDLKIPMPPNSSALRRNRKPQSPPMHRDRSDTDNPPDRRTTSGELPDVHSQREQRLARMHLAKTVCTVTGCKEKIWETYQELFGKQLTSAPIIPASNGTDIDDVDPVRDAFETAWFNWEG